MECKITADRLVTDCTALDSSVEHAVDTDFTLPDYCPDIGRIFKCSAQTRVSSRSVKGGVLRIEGTTKLDVCYLDSASRKIACFSKDIPFGKEMSAPDCPDGAKARISVRTDYMNCRAISQRKVDVHGALTVRAMINERKTKQIVTDVQGSGVKLRMTKRTVSVPVGNAQSNISVSEALDLSEEKPAIASILSADGEFCVSDVRTIANKVIVKGDLLLKILYRSDTDSNAESMSYTVPFNNFFDVSGADDGCVCDVSVGKAFTDISLRTDSDGEYRRIQAEVNADCDVAVYRQTEISAATDAYSTQCELALEREKITLKRYCSAVKERFIDRQSIAFDTSQLSLVKDITCRAGNASFRFAGGKAEAEIPVIATMLCENTDGDYELHEFPMTARGEFGIPEGCFSPEINPSVHVRGCSFSMTSGKIDIATELEVGACVYDGSELICITSVSPDESKQKRFDSEPAVVLYFADAGEDLWDIAREHNTSVERIKEENGLEYDETAEPCMLIVTA